MNTKELETISILVGIKRPPSYQEADVMIAGLEGVKVSLDIPLVNLRKTFNENYKKILNWVSYWEDEEKRMERLEEEREERIHEKLQSHDRFREQTQREGY